MASASVNIRVDEGIKIQAARLFEQLGLDMSTAVNIFLRQAILRRGIPFPVTGEPEVSSASQGGEKGPKAAPRGNENSLEVSPFGSPLKKKTPKPGCMKGKIWMAPDFDEPLEDFKDYM